MKIQPGYAQQGQPSSLIYGSTGQIGQEPPAGAMNIQPRYAQQGQTTTTLYPQIEHLVMRPTRFDVQPSYAGQSKTDTNLQTQTGLYP